MTHPSKIIKERNSRLRLLLKGESFTYQNSGHPRLNAVMATAMELSDRGLVELKQKRIANGTLDYIATGLLTENRMRKERNGDRND